MDDLRVKVFNAMCNDLDVMSEHGDDELSLLFEIANADDDVIEEYAETFL